MADISNGAAMAKARQEKEAQTLFDRPHLSIPECTAERRMTAQKESEETMKAYAKIAKIAMTVMLLAAFFLLSGFRAQTIIHDDGSETQDVLKVSDSAQGQKSLKDDADEFQKRNYTIMDYNNDNGEGFRAMKTITKDGASKSSVDHIVHKTHDGLICSTYYIDYNLMETASRACA